MSHYPVLEVQPRIRRTLIDFMSAAELEELRKPNIVNPLRKGRK
jgi:hypothetical protein